MAKFLPNPEDFWGPKQRAKRTKREEIADKEKAGQRPDADVDDSIPVQQKRAKLMQGWKKKKRPCDRFFSTGFCRFGDNCKFSHVAQPLTAAEELKEVTDNTVGRASEEQMGEENEAQPRVPHEESMAADEEATEPSDV